MKIEDVLKLIDAGYNKEEISAFEVEAPAPKEEAPKEEAPKEEAPAPKEEAPKEEGAEKLISNLQAQIKALTDAFHERNIREMENGGKQETVDDILKKMFEG